MANDDYEIISQKEIEHLKQEIKDLKEGKSPESPSNVVAKLNQMLDLFKEASVSMKEGKSDGSHKEILEKLDKLLDQNQKIAEGVLAVADLVGGEKEEEPKPEPKPMTPGPAFPTQAPPPAPGPMPPPGVASPSQSNAPAPQPIPGKPQMPSLNPMEEQGKVPMHDVGGGLPPLPPKPKKKGLFK